MGRPPYWLDAAMLEFPDPELALREPDGLLALGGDLAPERIIAAYRRGIFPWYEEPQPILWWSPNPRSVLPPDQLYLSRSLRKTINSGCFSASIDRHFTEVIEQCATLREHREGTWISPAMKQAYTTLHRQGYAHSIEILEDGVLVGGPSIAQPLITADQRAASASNALLADRRAQSYTSISHETGK